MTKIIVAGASGYIGRAVIPKLLQRFPEAEITAISRSPQKSEDPRVTWKACDLFSLKSLKEVLPEKADLALYLVHSMGPTAQLDQGSFADYDLLLADNFARAIQKLGVKHVIYLGGLVPDTPTLSLHLQSRLEIEQTFKSYHFPMTVFRAALILGEGGSSFQILLKLVKRLPIMICPMWTQNLTTPVSLSIVLNAIVTAAFAPEHIGKIYDLAGCKPLTYVDMMKQTAQHLLKRRYFIPVGFFTPTLSRLWVSLITNSPKSLVYPLVESLEHAMVARPSHLFSKDAYENTYSDLLNDASMKIYPGRSIFHFQPKRKTVRSLQRLPLPAGKNAQWMKERYFKWLPRFFKPFVIVTLKEDEISFSLLRRAWVMLQLKFNPALSDPDRQVIYIERGLLVSSKNKGRLEFRVVLNRNYVIAAIHDYRPSLPWYVYRFTQAKLHLFVMKRFAKHL